MCPVISQQPEEVVRTNQLYIYPHLVESILVQGEVIRIRGEAVRLLRVVSENLCKSSHYKSLLCEAQGRSPYLRLNTLEREFIQLRVVTSGSLFRSEETKLLAFEWDESRFSWSLSLNLRGTSKTWSIHCGLIPGVQ